MSLVTVILPAFNPGEFLFQAIASILGQSYTQWELIVVDDGSTDGSVEKARRSINDPRIRWLRQDNAGKPTAMNLALAHARGDFYAIQDADDISHPQRLEVLLRAMYDCPEVAAVFSGHDLILNERHIAPTFREKSIEACRKDIDNMAMPAHDPTAMYRMSAVSQMTYDVSLPIVEGYDYILRVGEMHPLKVIGKCLYSYRVHANSVTRQDPTRRDTLVAEAQRKACLRRGLNYNEWQSRQRKRLWRSESARRDNGLPSHFALSVHDLRNRGEFIGAIRTALQCARLHPLDPLYLKPAVYAVSPNWIRSRISRHA